MIFAVARTHFAKLKRDRAAFVLAFVVPVVFFSVFASIFGGSSSRAATRQIPVVIVDEDRTANSARFIAALKREKGLRVVDSRTLPDCLMVTATGGGVVMGVQHRELPAHGVQFHPESVLTPQGKRLLENFLAEPGPD